MAKFCGKCGAKLDDKTGLCPNCDAEQYKQSNIMYNKEEPKEIDNVEINLSKNSAPKLTRKQKKVNKKVLKVQKKANRTFGQKAKHFLKRVFLVLFLVLIILLVLSGVLAYFNIVEIPFVSGYFSDISFNYEFDTNYKSTKADMSGITYKISEEKHIVKDKSSGIRYVDNEILVILKNDSFESNLLDSLSTYNAKIVGKIDEIFQYQLLLRKNLSYNDVKKLSNQLEKENWVVEASPNLAIEYNTDYYPNDSKWNNKWEDIPDGDNWGAEAIGAPFAWDYKNTMQSVNVGVIDTMFDESNSDLVFQESPLGNLKALQKYEFNDDQSNHGTHVSGIIGATFDNQKGIAGVFPKSKMYGVSIRGLTEYKYKTIMSMKIALSYLIITKKCKVVNISMGSDWLSFEASRGTQEAINQIDEWSSEISDLLEIILSKNYEFVICKSAGNQNEVGGGYKYFKKDDDDNELKGGNYYPYDEYLKYLSGELDDQELCECFKKYKNRQKEIEKRLESGNVDARFDEFSAIMDEEIKNRIIVVGAAKNKGYHKENSFLWVFGGDKVHDGYEIAEFSNCGERVDLIAPGYEILSTKKNGFCKMSGTSQATPQVSGVASMLFALDSDIKGNKVKKIIKESATGEYGNQKYGILNARLASEKLTKSDENKTIQQANVDATAPKSESSGRDIVLVLDASGSMSGTPLDETKKAATKFVDTVMGHNAQVGIVKYDDEAEIVSPFSDNSTSLKSSIEDISSGDSTNIEDGLSTAEDMLSSSSSKKKIIVLMSDGEPNEGKEGDELIEYANELKEKGIYIYTLGFFDELDSDKSSAQYLMEKIASEGCHYEVSDSDSLVYFFGDIADQINGQKFIYVRIACPVDVSVKHNGETLSSSDISLNTRTSFGSLSFEETDTQSYSDSYEDYLDEDTENVDKVKILRLKEGEDYDIKINGTDRGRMNYSIGFMDDDGEYSDFRKFNNVKITSKTRIDTVATVTDKTVMNVDENGDGKYDLIYEATANGRAKLVETPVIIYIILILIGILVLLILILILCLKIRNKRRIRT